MQSIKQSNSDFRNNIRFTIFLIGAMGVLSMPISTIEEFGWIDFKNFYSIYYPHITIYPLFIYWCSIIGMIFCWTFVPLNKKSKIISKFIIYFSIIIAFIIALAEQMGDRMMIIEFRKEVQEQYCMKEIIEHSLSSYGHFTSDKADSISAYFKSSCSSYYSLEHKKLESYPTSIFVDNNKSYNDFSAKNDELFSYRRWIDPSPGMYEYVASIFFGNEFFSKTRSAYIITVFSITFIVSMTLMSALVMPRNFATSFPKKLRLRAQQKSQKYKVRSKFSSGLILSLLGLLMWIPCRLVFNSYKSNLFISDGLVIDNFSNTETVVLLALVIFIVFFSAEKLQWENDRVKSTFELIGFLGGGLLIQNQIATAKILGVYVTGAEPFMWLLWFLLILISVAYFYLREIR